MRSSLNNKTTREILLMLSVVDKFGYDADVMTKITNNLAKPLHFLMSVQYGRAHILL